MEFITLRVSIIICPTGDMSPSPARSNAAITSSASPSISTAMSFSSCTERAASLATTNSASSGEAILQWFFNAAAINSPYSFRTTIPTPPIPRCLPQAPSILHLTQPIAGAFYFCALPGLGLCFHSCHF